MIQITDKFQGHLENGSNNKSILYGTILKTPQMRYSKATEFDCLFDAYARIVQQYRKRFTKHASDSKRYHHRFLNAANPSHNAPFSRNIIFPLLSHRTPECNVGKQKRALSCTSDSDSRKHHSTFSSTRLLVTETPALHHPQFSLMRALSDPLQLTPNTQPKALRPVLKRRR